MDQAGIELLDHLQVALEEMVAQTAVREAALTYALHRVQEQWAAWQAQEQERTRQFAGRQQEMQAFEARATQLVAETEAGFEQIEMALCEWLSKQQAVNHGQLKERPEDASL